MSGAEAGDGASARRHREVVAPVRPSPTFRPRPGPLALLPRFEEPFNTAVRAAGGEVGPLGPGTRGIIWLSSERADELEAVVEAHPGVGWVQLPWAGVDAFAGVIRRRARDDLLWTSAKGAYAQPVAEHALMLMLALLRVVPLRLAERAWTHRLEGRSLYGRRIVIIGAGGIALELIRLLEPFGARVTVVRRRSTPVAGAERTVRPDALNEVLPTAELVVIAAALTAETARLIGAAELALLPDDALVVNVARGGLVDTSALSAALHAGRLGGAGLDVTDPEPLPPGHPLWNAPNTIVTPHAADTPAMTAPLLAERIRGNVRAFLGEGDFMGVVDTDLGY